MDFFEAIILGFIQGVAEWLPVSSEGMVTLAGKFFAGLDYKEALGTAIWLHSGTLLSAVIYFRNDIIDIISSVFRESSARDLTIFLLIATLASAAVAFPLLFLAFSLEVPESLATLLIGCFLVAVALMQKNRTAGVETEPDPKKAVLAGLFQGLSVLPGLSRSGITVSVLLSERFSLKQAFRLSFLMSIPVTLGAQVALPLVQGEFTITLPMIAGSITAMLVGLVSIRILMGFAEKVNFFRATLALGLFVIALGAFLFLSG